VVTTHPSTSRHAIPGLANPRGESSPTVASHSPKLTWSARLLLGVVALASLVIVELHFGASQPVQIIRNAVCAANASGGNAINCNSSGLGGITNAAEALISPILVALFAVAPIACLVGVGAVMVGSRRGIVIIASALGALVLAGAIKGIVA
jgi:hypothetical protein